MSEPHDEMERDEDLVEIDWLPLQGAIDAMAAAGLDFDDNDRVLDHVGVLLGALLRKIQEDEGHDDADMAELAAELAAFAVDLAVGDDELPPFAASDQFDA